MQQLYMARKFLGKPQHLYVRILFWQAWTDRSQIGTLVYKKKENRQTSKHPILFIDKKVKVDLTMHPYLEYL